ncbi:MULTISPECIES: hypothetical protein [Gordonia]|uniref:hypothetical protein n=1 Tax=Gordonia TaxID=2053 RepID=UPI0030FEF48A
MSTLLDDRKTGPERSAGAGARTEKARGERRPRRTRGTATVERANRSKAAQRALDRRERRIGPVGPRGGITSRRIAGVPLVFPVLLLIVGALGLTLYLTTKSAQDSYALDALRSENQSLSDRRDDLQRTFDKADAAPELAAKAAEQGMVPADGALQVTVGESGSKKVRGTATPADGKPLPALNPEPNPVAKIDADKVDDSQGLGTTGTTSTEPTSTDRATAPTSSTPAPNVVPRSAATPRPNTARAR